MHTLRFNNLVFFGVFWGLTLVMASADNSLVIAHIGQTEVRASEVLPLMAQMDPQTQAALAKDPNQLAQVVRSLLVQKLLLQEALSKKWDQQPDVVAQLKQAREDKIVDTYLKSVAKVPDTFPSEAELQSGYELAKPRLLSSTQYRLAQIFIAAPTTASPVQQNLAQSRMESLLQELAKPEADFAALATTRSDDKVTAAHEGEIGWVLESQVEPSLRSQFTSLPKGAISPPIRLLDGWHILKCLDIKPPYTLSLAEVKTQLIQQLRNDRARALAQSYLESVANQTALTIDPTALSTLFKK